MTYRIIQDPKIHSLSRTHAIESDGSIICGKSVGLHWQTSQDSDDLTVYEAIELTTCKVCVRKLEKLMEKG